jgi:hypothetical protein
MAERLHTRKRGNSLAVWAITVIVAGLVFYGIWVFLSSHGQVRRHPPGIITHSTPVGGTLEDGVFRSGTQEADPYFTRWRI